MWSEQRGTRTDVWMDYSATGPRFGAPKLLERSYDPSGPPPGSPQLIRLSSESVMSAWGGVEAGRWVLRTAPIDQHGLRTVGTIAAPEGDALLAALAPGPRGEAVALFTEPQAAPAGEALLGEPQAGHLPPALMAGPQSPSAAQGLFAVRGIETAGRTQFGAPEAIAPVGPVSGASVAIEPSSDRAVAAWQGAGGVVYYSLRIPDPAG
jgi:hypothetical protein